MVYLDQFVCLSDGVNLKVVATSIAEIDRPVYHDVRNSMPHPTKLEISVPTDFSPIARALAQSWMHP